MLQSIIDLFFSSGIAETLAKAAVGMAGLFLKVLAQELAKGIGKLMNLNDPRVQYIQQNANKSQGSEKSVKSYGGMLPSYSVKSFNFPKNTVTKSTTNSFNINITGGVTTSASELVREIERQIVRRVSV